MNVRLNSPTKLGSRRRSELHFSGVLAVDGGIPAGAGIPSSAAWSSLFVMLGDKAVEEPHAKRSGALRHRRRVLFRPGDTGDVEMRPRYLVDKALHKLRADDAAGGAVAGDVLDIGGVAVDRPVV